MAAHIIPKDNAVVDRVIRTTSALKICGILVGTVTTGLHIKRVYTG